MLTLIKSSFIDYKLTILRNKKTSNSFFRQTMNEVSYLIAAEVLKTLKFKQVTIFERKPGFELYTIAKNSLIKIRPKIEN